MKRNAVKQYEVNWLIVLIDDVWILWWWGGGQRGGCISSLTEASQMILFIKCSLAVTHLFPARDEKQYFIQQKWLIENGAVHSGGRRFFSSCAVLAWSWKRWAQLCTPYRLTEQFVLFKIYSFKKVTLNAKKQCFNYDATWSESSSTVA